MVSGFSAVVQDTVISFTALAEFLVFASDRVRCARPSLLAVR